MVPNVSKFNGGLLYTRSLIFQVLTYLLKMVIIVSLNGVGFGMLILAFYYVS